MAEPIVVCCEPWTDALYEQELHPLVEAHAREVAHDAGAHFKLDLEIMRAIAAHGVLKVLVARRAGRAVGYLTWNLSRDVEAEGMLIAQQGGWYVAPGNWRAAVMLFDASIEVLRDAGVHRMFPHHRLQGRGAGLGRFFRRRGASEIQRTYCLQIGED
jgi:hypothetical protein